jgi:putative addiction module component (TIGR02574 family)
MGLAELKRVVDELPVEERLELAQHIRQSTRTDDSAWQAEIGRRLDSCLQGKGHTAEELLAVHNRLSADGR